MSIKFEGLVGCRTMVSAPFFAKQAQHVCVMGVVSYIGGGAASDMLRYCRRDTGEVLEE